MAPVPSPATGDTAELQIGGRPVLELQAQAPLGRPGVIGATIAPGRGMMLLQARAAVPGLGEIDILSSPSLAEAAQRLDGGPDDFAGNASFGFGGAILLPYANRVRGRPLAETRELVADVGGASARLPRNWGGRAEGAEQYAMHGLILDRAVGRIEQASPDRVRGRMEAGDFGGRWPSSTRIDFGWRLQDGALLLEVTATNLGDETLPMGIGWHPYFALPSGLRDQAVLHVPARSRLQVDDYDQVLPTGEVLELEGAFADFAREGGAALGATFLDDCFVDLAPKDGAAVAEVRDPAAGYGLRISAAAPPVRAIQVFAPPADAVVVVEPQFNWADPFGQQWTEAHDTGMARLAPGEAVTYAARVELFAC